MTLEDERCELNGAAGACRQFFDKFREALAEKLVLPPRLVEQAAIGLVSGGHLLVEGHPGLGKRTLAQTLAQLGGLSFSAVSCTPEMEPGELVGDEQLREDEETRRRAYRFLPGPLFAQVAYVEDIHLAPPKCRAVLANSMRSGQIGQGRLVQDLPSPFAVIASVAPDLEDTDMALDPSLADRFLLKLTFDYPSETEEWEIGRRAGQKFGIEPEPLISAEQMVALQQTAGSVEMPDAVLGYAWALVRATRPGNDLAPEFVETWIRLGISPQGLTSLVSAAKARALLRGRARCTRRDVYEVTPTVFRHRLCGSEESLAAALTVDRLINMLLERISLDGEYQPEQAS